MFHAFISTRRPPSLCVRGVVASAAFHVALLSTAFGSHPAHVTSVPRAMGERVQQIDVAYAPPVVVPTRGPAPVVRVTTPPRPRPAVMDEDHGGALEVAAHLPRIVPELVDDGVVPPAS